MPPKGGRKYTRPTQGTTRQQRTTTTQGSSSQQRSTQGSVTTTQPSQSHQPQFGIAPLILEGASLNKLQLNDLLKTQLADVQVHNIQLGRNGTFTVYAKDVKSFNRLLNDLTPILANNGTTTAKVFVPRSIQKVQDTEKIAFVKRVDLEIPIERISEALKEKGLAVTEVIRLKSKDKTTDSQTLKISFSDTSNRNTLVQTGLQIDYMHFEAEPASQNSKPVQCFTCMKFNHVAKYCKSDHPTCARCGENHQLNQCTVADDAVKCANCKGNHLATSSDCPIYKSQQKKVLQMINQYTTTNKQATQVPSLYSSTDFPQLSQFNQPQKIVLTENLLSDILTSLTNKMESILEETTTRLFSTLSKKILRFERTLNQLTRTNTEENQREHSDSDSNEEESSSDTINTQRQHQSAENQTTSSKDTSTKPKPSTKANTNKKTTTHKEGTASNKRSRTLNDSSDTSNNARKDQKLATDDD